MCFLSLSLSAQTWVRYNNTNSGLPVNTVHDMDLDTSNHKLWIGTSHYLVTLEHDSIWDTISTVFPNNPWFAVKVDSRGDTWVGGDTDCRLYRFSNGNMTEFTDSLNSIGEVRAIEEDAHGNIWVGLTSSYGLRMYDGNRWYDYSDSIGNEGIWAMELGFDSLMWFGSWAEELFSYDGQKFTHYSASNSPMPNSQVRSIARGVYPDMWIGTRAGLLRFDGDTTWQHWTESNSSLYDNEIYSIAVDNDTVSWLGYNGGSSLGKRDSTGFSLINYPFNSVSFTHSIVIAPDGRKYIGGQGGLLAYNGGGSGPVQAPIRANPGPNAILESDSGLELYPNPSQGVLNISGLDEDTEIVIFSLDGKRISGEVARSQSSIRIVLPETKGFYIVQLSSDSRFERRKVLRL